MQGKCGFLGGSGLDPPPNALKNLRFRAAPTYKTEGARETGRKIQIYLGVPPRRENKVKSIKMLGLAALAALTAMAFVGDSSAMASNTQLCKTDPGAGACTSAVTHVHETSLTGAKGVLLSSVINVECDVLFLSTSVGTLGVPQVIEGKFTYSNCNSGCEVKEVGGPASIEALKTGHETAAVTGEGEVNVHCGFLINCTYNGEGLEATAKGPLLSSETNGSVKLSGQETSSVSGFCPEHAFLDLTTTPLTATYIGE